MKINVLKLLSSISLCLAVGFTGSYFTISSIPTWYMTLAKPFFSPPNWIFGPVWTILYIMMGISLYLVWNKKGSGNLKQYAYKLFFIQLVLNFFWSIIFFGFHSPIFALFEILLLWIAIFLTIRVFNLISINAAKLLYPYLAWVTFASFLNLSIVFLN